MKNTAYHELNSEQKKLLDSAEKAMKNAYCPYSNFKVGAAVLSQEGKIITGTNIENAAYESVCAEKTAISKANSMGFRKFKKIAIIAKADETDTKEVTAPCGSCRQIIYEVSQISKEDIEVIMATTKKDKIIIATISELLPLGLGPRDIGIGIKEHQ